MISHRSVRTALALLLALGTARAARSQSLPIKRTLALPPAGCARAAASAPAQRTDNSEARRLAAQGREAALVGDQAAARDAFRRAAALNPNDDQVAYALGRADEELADAAGAVTAYCRYLALSPQGRDAEDVQQRVLRLAPGAAADARRARARFDAGVSALDRSQWAEAVAAFDDVVRAAPGATEAVYDRALALLRLDRRSEAARDLEQYVSASQSADDRAAVLRALDVVRRPAYAPGTAFARGLLLPGLGQFSTGRPALGAVALGAVGAAVVAMTYQRVTLRDRTFLDPFGKPYVQAVPDSTRPYLAPAAIGGAAVWLLAALEARHYAAGTTHGVARTALRAASAVRVSPFSGVRGATSVGFSLGH